MSKVFATNEFRQQIASWLCDVGDPNDAPGVDRGLGSVYDRAPTFPTVPLETYFMQSGEPEGWSRQNLVNLRVFNVVRDFGAINNGTGNNRTVFRTAVAAVSAAGGGILYCPPGTYRFLKITGVGREEGVVYMTDLANVYIVGDGYSTLFSFEGITEGRTTELFRVDGTARRIGFHNIRFQSNFSDVPSEQTHFIQFSPDNPVIPGEAPIDLWCTHLWFNPIRGDSIRLLGSSGEFVQDAPVYRLRVFWCTFNTDDNSRCGMSYQRDNFQTVCNYNWFAETMAQSIEWEPGAGFGPSQAIIVGNIIENPGAEISVTLSGAIDGDVIPQVVYPATKNLFAFNILINGGTVEGLWSHKLIILGNIVQVVSDTGFDVCEFRNMVHGVIDANIFCSESLVPGDERGAIFLFQDNPGENDGVQISNNICKIIITDTPQAAIRLNDVPHCTVSGNLCFVDEQVVFAGATSAIQFRAVSFDGNDWVMVGNLAIATGDRILAGCRFATEPGMDAHNILCSFNMTSHTDRGVDFASAGPDFWLDWRMVDANNVVDATVSTVALPNTNVGVSTAGTAGPGPQFTTLLLAAGPNSVVTAPPGSVCNNNVATAASGLWWKESGTGATGWVSDGADEIVWGVLTAEVTTAARFLPNGQGAAIEQAAEYSMVLPRRGQLRNMRVRCVAGTGGGNNVFTVRLNGANTALSATVANTGTTGTDNDVVPVVAGDRISLRVTKDTIPGTAQTFIVVTVELTS